MEWIENMLIFQLIYRKKISNKKDKMIMKIAVIMMMMDNNIWETKKVQKQNMMKLFPKNTRKNN